MSRRGRWSAEEDAILEAHYPDHGGAWEGWEELLPGRSAADIRRRAGYRGLRVTPEALSAGRRRAQAAGAAARAATPDPLERRIMALLDRGLPPSAIDARLKRTPGTAARVISARWRRHKESKEDQE